MMNKANPTGSHLASTSKSKSLGQKQQPVNTPPASVARTRPPNLPSLDPIKGSRENYISNRMHLYNAMRKCKWGMAKAILKENRELVRCSLTKNGETALHIVATENENIDTDTTVHFVRYLVSMMEEKDLELENQNYETAFFLAAKHGNVLTVMSMLGKNSGLMIIPGGQGQMMPLYAAALYGNYEVVKYLYEKSNELQDDDGWTTVNRGLLLEKCVQADMFGVALRIVKTYPELGNERILGILARKPEAFYKREPNIIKSIINPVLNLLLSKEEEEEESEALQILKVICKENDKKPEKEIYDIFISSDDSVKEENRTTTLLEMLIYEHLTKLEVEIQNIMGGPPHATSGKLDKALQLQKVIYEYLKSMHVETQNLINEESKSVFSKRDLQLQTVISQHLTRLHVGAQHIIKHEPQNENQALKLHKLISEQITLMRDLTIPTDTYSFRMLFIAAEMGNTVFLVELISRYPDLVWKVNEENQTIFHIAVKYRHVDIYMLLYQLGSMRDLIACRTDANGNNMLHLVGKLPTKQRLEEMVGPALQMERELKWFKEVRKMIPINYRETKNKDGLTPQELFTEEHRQLVTEGERWLKETSAQSMVVAALISAVVFAAAFTVPGGYQDNGTPNFYGKSTFVVFVLADAISMLSSATALLMFLIILTSRHSESDFLSSSPKKLNVGFSSLLISVATMMLTFAISFFILYHNEWRWIPIVISTVTLYILLPYISIEFDFISEFSRIAYSHRYPFIHRKQFIYYANPRV